MLDVKSTLNSQYFSNFSIEMIQTFLIE